MDVQILDSKGQPCRREQLRTLHATDRKHRPFPRRITVSSDGTVNLTGFDEPVFLHAKVDIEGYGFMWVEADHGGQGYAPGSKLNFIEACAQSRIEQVNQYLKRHDQQGSAACRSLLSDAAYRLDKAADSANADRHRHAALASALWAGELAAIEVAKARIAARAPRRDFLFGCGGFHFPYDSYPDLKEKFTQAFNYATLPFYLSRLEPEKGKPRYDTLDKLIDAFDKEGIQCKGHPLWWAHSLHGVPPWAEDLSWQNGDLQKEIERVVKRSVKRYQGRIPIFDAINEAHDWCNAFNLTQDEEVLMSKHCCDMVHEADPSVKAVINSCFLFGENVADERVQFGPVFPRLMTPYEYYERLEEKGAEYEVIGLQLYCPARDLLSIAKLLERFAAFGKPIHLTELGVPSADVLPPVSASDNDLYCLRYMYHGHWRQPEWDEKLQADWLEGFYTLTYAQPSIEALTWWSLLDPGYIPGSGLFYRDGTAKEAYFRLLKLKEDFKAC